jgi:hypothetical protein
MVHAISEELYRVAESIETGPPIRDWGIKIQESQKYFDALKEALKTHDGKKILDAQLKLCDLYNVPRTELLQQIKEVVPKDKISEILHGGSPL